MAYSPQNPDPQKLTGASLKLFSRPVLGVLLGLGALGGVATWRGLSFVEHELAPLIEENMLKLLNRPVKLGELKRYSLTELEFGRSSIPPHPTQVQGKTVLDADRAEAESVVVKFNPWMVLVNRTLPVDVVLNRPVAYVDQNPDDRWIGTKLSTLPDTGWLKIKLNSIRTSDATVTLAPTVGSQRVLQQAQGVVSFREENRLIEGRGSATIDSGGRVALTGTWKAPQQDLALTAQTQGLAIAPLFPLLPPTPLQVSAGKFDGQVKVRAVASQPLQIASKGTLVQPVAQWSAQSIDGKAERVVMDVVATVPSQQPFFLKGKASVQNGEGQVPEDLILVNGRKRRQTARAVNGTLNFLGASQQMTVDAKGQLAAGGQVAVKGKVKLPLEEASLLVQAQNVPAALLDRAYRLPVQVTAGQVGGNLTVQLKKNQRPSVTGTASLKGVNAAIPGVPQPFLNSNGLVRLSGLTATLEDVTSNYGTIPVRARGSIDPDRGYDLTADTPPIEVNRALQTLKVPTLPFPVAGQVQAVGIRVGGAILQPVLTGQVQNVGTVTLDRIPVRTASANFKLVPSLLTVSEIAAQPTDGGQVTGQATLQIPTDPSQSVLNAQFQGKGLSGDAIARLYEASPGFAIGLVGGTALVAGQVSDLETAVQFQAPQGVYPTVGRAIVRQGKTALRDVVAQVKGGQIRVNGLVADNRVNLTAQLPGIALAGYGADLRGALSGQLDIVGPLAGFSPRTARAQGGVRFSEGLSLLQDPLAATIRWDGQQILVDRATAPNFEAQGVVGADLQNPQGPQITTLNLDVLAQRFDLNRLATPGLSQNPLAGLANLKGKLSGTVTAPTLVSQVEVETLQVSKVAFEPLMVGTLNLNPTQGINLNLGGTRDRIQIALDAQQRPLRVDLRRDTASIVGQRDTPNTFNLVATDVPLMLLNEFPQIADNLGPLSGNASGTLALNVQTLETQGEFRVQDPGLGRRGYGRLVGDSLTGQVRYANGVATLKQAELIQGPNRYQLDATLSNWANPQVTGRVLIAQAQVEDLLSVGQILNDALNGVDPATPDLGRAANIQTNPVALSNIPLWQQLQRLAEVDALLAQRQTQNGSATLPKLKNLKGTLAGEIQFSGSLQTGVSGSFDLKGQNWDLEPYRIETVIAKGRLDESGLTVEPLSLTDGERKVVFQGRIGGDRQSGQLTVQQVPIETIADLLDLPLDITGNINGSATLAGQWDNPTLQGQLSLEQGVLNRTQVQNASTQFSYRDARLAFSGTANLDTPEPIQIEGDVPYALPFSAVKPTTNQINIAMAVKNQGLGLVNLFTDQVAWVDGQGNLNLRVQGTLDKPLMRGNLALQNATLRSPTFPEPLTQVNGAVQFNSDRLNVENLTGRYNNGELVVNGSIPIFDEKLPVRTPLSVSLNNTALNLKGLYQGQASGNLNVAGSAFRPVIRGIVALENGQVFLAAATTPQGDTVTPVSAGAGAISTTFDGLQVRLGDNIRILQPPVLSFVATGQIDLDGSVDAPRPTGIVRFKKGNVYLFTTLFRVDERKDNFAQFTPAFGLDPYLNLSLRTTVTEVAAGRTTSLNEFAVLQAGTLGSLESVRVRANIQGRASQLNTRFGDVLELTSVPNRTQNEILALLSGGITQSLEQGDAQGALINFASSAFLNRFQGLVDDVLGSRASFRLFPVLTPARDPKTNDGSVLNLGAEFGYDVTDRLSVSLLQVVTTPNELPQLNLSYDFTDQLRLRSSVNFQGEAVGILEYRLRF